MIERQIVIGLITSTAYLKKIRDIWNLQLLESTTARRIAGWCWEYYDKYDKAPGRDIEAIYFTKVKAQNFPKAIAEEFEQDILPGLSKEYENEEFNLDYLLEESTKHFNERHLQVYTTAIQALLSEGKIEEAEDLVRQFKPLGAVIHKIDDFILTAGQIRSKKRPQPITYMKPWLKGGQMTIIYGNYGSGKSLLSICVAYMLGVKEYNSESCEIDKWLVKTPTGCLYMDGELGEIEMEARIKQFEWLGKQPPEHRLRVFAVPDYQLETEDTFTIADRLNQQKIIKWLREHPTYKLIILDSASTLFGLQDENNNSEWNNKINPFLRDLRALDVACLLLHHAGKDGKKGLRGASAMGAMAHNIFRLTNHPDQVTDEGEAWFKLTLEKQRASGKSFRPFSLHFMQNGNETTWEVTENT